MPTPIGHSLTTLGLAEVSEIRKSGRILFLLMTGVLPDIDLILDKFPALKEIGFYHQGITHTFMAGLAFSSIVYLFTRDFRWALVVFLAYSLHVALDLFMIDTRPPIGFKPFWPFYNGLINIPLLPGVDKSSLASLLSLRTFKTLCWETAFFSYIYIIILGVKIWTGKRG